MHMLILIIEFHHNFEFNKFKMKLAYIINQYPSTSHTFIRREILGLEARRLDVVRFTLRCTRSNLVDAADQAEQQQTRVVLGVGAVGLVMAVIRTAITRPRAFVGLGSGHGVESAIGTWSSCPSGLLGRGVCSEALAGDLRSSAPSRSFWH